MQLIIGFRSASFLLHISLDRFCFEYRPPQSSADLRLGLYLDTVLVDSYRVQVLRVRCAPHLWNLDLASTYLHSEGIFLQRVALDRVLLKHRLAASAFFECVMKPDHPVDHVFLHGLATCASRVGRPIGLATDK